MARLYKTGNNVTDRSEAAERWPLLIVIKDVYQQKMLQNLK